jgi:hypothetical protein
MKDQTHEPAAPLNMYYMYAYKAVNDVTDSVYALSEKSIILLAHLELSLHISLQNCAVNEICLLV